LNRNERAPLATRRNSLIAGLERSDATAPEKLAPLIYAELKRLARRYMRRESPVHTLETGALLNEAYVRLADWKNARWENRSHFYAVAAELMRRVLVDHARTRASQKRGGGVRAVALEEGIVTAPERSPDIVALDEAMKRLAEFDLRKSKVVELRFFGGLSVEETAAVLGVSPFTVIRDWNLAKAWLQREIRNRTP